MRIHSIASTSLATTDRVQFFAEHLRRPAHRRDVQKAAVRDSWPFAFSRSCGSPGTAISLSTTAAFLDPSPGAEPAINPMEARSHPRGAGPTFGAPTRQPKGSFTFRSRFPATPSSITFSELNASSGFSGAPSSYFPDRDGFGFFSYQSLSAFDTAWWFGTYTAIA